MLSGLKGYLLKEAGWIFLALLVISFITFVLCRFVPGDPVAIRNPKADPETIARIREEMGFNRPIPIQYFDYMSKFVRGNMGESIRFPDRSVKELLFPRLWVSLQINILALLLSLPIGMILGIIAAKYRGRLVDHLIIITSLIPRAIPSIIFIQFLLLILVLRFQLLPASMAGWSGIFSLKIIIPLLVLSLPAIGGFAEFVRVSVLHVLEDDYVRTAYAKGLSEKRVILRHILPNASAPIVTTMILALAGLLEGSLFAELFYGIDGAGRLMFDSFFQRDLEVIMAFTIIISALFLVSIRLSDLVLGVIDKRIRIGAQKR